MDQPTTYGNGTNKWGAFKSQSNQNEQNKQFISESKDVIGQSTLQKRSLVAERLNMFEKQQNQQQKQEYVPFKPKTNVVTKQELPQNTSNQTIEPKNDKQKDKSNTASQEDQAVENTQKEMQNTTQTGGLTSLKSIWEKKVTKKEEPVKTTHTGQKIQTLQQQATQSNVGVNQIQSNANLKIQNPIQPITHQEALLNALKKRQNRVSFDDQSDFERITKSETTNQEQEQISPIIERRTLSILQKNQEPQPIQKQTSTDSFSPILEKPQENIQRKSLVNNPFVAHLANLIGKTPQINNKKEQVETQQMVQEESHKNQQNMTPEPKKIADENKNNDRKDQIDVITQNEKCDSTEIIERKNSEHIPIQIDEKETVVRRNTFRDIKDTLKNLVVFKSIRQDTQEQEERKSDQVFQSLRQNFAQVQLQLEVLEESHVIEEETKEIEEINPTQIAADIFRTKITRVESEEEDAGDQGSAISRNSSVDISRESKIYQSVMFAKASNSNFDNIYLSNFRSSEMTQSMFRKVIINRKTFQMTEIQSEDHYQINIKKITKLQAMLRSKAQQKIYKIKRKRNRYRMNVIKEIIDTEARYVQDLTLISEKIETPLLDLMTKQDVKKVFINMDSIIGLNQGLLDELKKQFQKYYHYQTTMEVVVLFIPFFKIYFEYCKGYSESSKAQEILLKTNQKYQDFLQYVKRTNLLKGSDLSDYVIKPVQRLPKYVLLYKDLLKHTDLDHPDYGNIRKCLEEFSKINNANNQNMEKQLGQVKMFELQRTFPNIQLLDSKREFKFEETCTLYIDETEKSVILYAFTDLLLFTLKEDNQEKLLNQLFLGPNSVCKDQEDRQFLSHLFKVVAQNDSAYFVCENQATKKKLMDDISAIILNLREIAQLKRNKSILQDEHYMITVEVIATEERCSTQFKTHTVYLTRITVNEFTTKLYLRYSVISELGQKVKKKYPNVQIPHLSNKNWFTNRSAKVIEERKILIEKTLQVILSAPDLLLDQNSVLEKIGLPLNLYQEASKRMKLAQSQVLTRTTTLDDIAPIRNTLTPNQIESAASIIKAQRQIHSERTSLVGKSRLSIGRDAEECMYNINIVIMDGRVITVGFEKETMVIEVVEFLANKIQLREFSDFKLFQSDGLENYRVLQDEAILSQMFLMKKKAGFMNLFQPKDIKQIFFRKQLFLDKEKEEKDLLNDPVRLRLVAYQAIENIREEKYPYSVNEYLLFAAFYLYLQDQNFTIENYSIEKIKQFIPQTVLKNVTFQQWTQQLFQLYEQIREEIVTIRNNNQKLSKEKGKQYIIDREQICQLALLTNLSKSNILFGASLYPLEVPQATIDKGRKCSLFFISNNILISINYRSINLIATNKVQSYGSYSLDQVVDLKAFTNEIIIEFQNIKLEFTTSYGYEIRSLFLQYKDIQRLVGEYN